MSMEELLARVQVLEDIEAIRKLKATYCYLCDAGLGDARVGMNCSRILRDDAKVDFGLGPASMYEGKEGLKIFFGQSFRRAFRFACTWCTTRSSRCTAIGRPANGTTKRPRRTPPPIAPSGWREPTRKSTSAKTANGSSPPSRPNGSTSRRTTRGGRRTAASCWRSWRAARRDRDRQGCVESRDYLRHGDASGPTRRVRGVLGGGAAECMRILNAQVCCACGGERRQCRSGADSARGLPNEVAVTPDGSRAYVTATWGRSS